jgi:catechol 2,3-dioxygenase-like lactoylglutathione lyase family enzyme
MAGGYLGRRWYILEAISMGLFSVDSLVMCYSNLEVAKRWWIEVFGCTQVALPDWDDPLPSDVALKLAGDDEPTILLCDQRDVQKAGLERPNDHPLMFSGRLTKAREHLVSKGAAPGPIQAGGKRFFEIHDPEGNVVEICKE